MRSYVTYDVVTGDIKGVANQIPVLEEDSLAYINVDYEVVEDILLGRKTTRLYCVTYNPALEVHEFRERTNFNADDLTINDLIYKVPTKEDYNAHICVIQDIGNTCWKFLIHRDLEVQLRSENAGINTTLHFAVTEFNNPNILYKSLVISLNQLLKNHYQILDFTEDFEKDPTVNFSLFTIKRFKSYAYVRING